MSFSSFTSSLKLKTHSQLTQSPFTGTDRLFLFGLENMSTMTEYFTSFCVGVSGIAIGHIYYFLEDVFPEQPGGFKILRTPIIL